MAAVKDTANNRISMGGSGNEGAPHSIFSVVADINDASWISISNGVVTLYKDLDFYRGFLRIPDNVTVVETTTGHLVNTNNTNPSAGNGIELVGGAKIICSGASGAGFGYGVQGGYGTYKTTPLNDIYPIYAQQSGQRYDTVFSAMDSGFNTYTLLKSGGVIQAGASVSDPFGATLSVDNSGIYIGQLIYRNAAGAVIWGSGTYSATAGNYAVMQTDGNLVIYTAGGGVAYAFGTTGPGAYIATSNSGGLAIVSARTHIPGTSIIRSLYQFASMPSADGDYDGIVYKVDGTNVPLRNESHFKWYGTGYLKNINLQRAPGYAGATPTALQVHYGVTVENFRTSEFAVSGDWPEGPSVNRVVRTYFDVSSPSPLKGYFWSGTWIDIIDPLFAAGGAWNGLISPDGVGGTGGVANPSTIGPRLRHKVMYNATAAKGSTKIQGVKLCLAPTRTGSASLSEAVATQYLLTDADGKIAEQTLLYKEWFPTTTTPNQPSNTTTTWRVTARHPLYTMAFDLQAAMGAESLVIDAIAASDNTTTALTLAQVASPTAPYSGVTFNRAEKRVTITSARTAQQGYDTALWWLYQDSQMDFADFSSYAGAVWDVTDWGIAGIEYLTGSIKSTGTLTAGGAMSSLSVQGNVTQQTPTNLSKVTITGNLTYNSAANITVTLTNTTIAGTISNSGAGAVTVISKGTTSIGTVGTRVTSVLSSTLTLGTSSGDTVGIYNASGAQVDLTVASGEYTLNTSGGVGVYTGVVERYGYVRQEFTFSPSAGDAAPNLVFVPDVKIVQTTKATVAAYTSLNTTAQQYDYEAYARTVDPKYNLAAMEGQFINYGSTAILVDATASAVRSYNATTNKLTIKSTSCATNFKTSTTLDTANGASVASVYTTGSGTSVAITVNISQSGARLLLKDSNNSQRYNAVVAGTSVTRVFAPGATGTWNGTVALYGYGHQAFSVTVTGGGAFSTSVVLNPDSSVSATLSAVSAYTSLTTSQQVKDWTSYYTQTAAGIVTPIAASLTASSINLGSMTLAKGGTLGYSYGVITTGSNTISGANIVTSATQSMSAMPSLTYPQQLTDSTGTTNWVKIDLEAGQRAYDTFTNSVHTESYKQLVLSNEYATVTWYIGEYGYFKKSGEFVITSGLAPAVSAVLTPDGSITSDYSTAISKTVLSTVQEVANWAAAYEIETPAGMQTTRVAGLISGNLDIGANTLAKAASVGFSAGVIGINSNTLTGGGVVTTATQSTATAPTLVYPYQFKDATGQTNWLKATLTTGQKFYSDYDNIERTASFELVLPSSFTSSVKRAIYRRGYKTDLATVPYSTATLPVQSSVLTQDVNIIDTTTDYITNGISNAQQAYDCIGQYLTTSAGCFETYAAIKAFGSVDFGAKNISLLSAFAYSANAIAFKCAGLVGTDMYVSTGTINTGTAALGDGVKLRYSNIDSELTMTGIDKMLFFPSLIDALALQNQGRTLTGVNTFRYLYGSTDTGVVLNDQIYAWVTSGSTTYQVTIPISKGATNFAKDTAAQLTELQSNVVAIQKILAGSNVNAVTPNFTVDYSSIIGASSPIDGYSWTVVTKAANGTLAGVEAYAIAVVVNKTGVTYVDMGSVYDEDLSQTSFTFPTELVVAAGDLIKVKFTATIDEVEANSPAYVSTVQLTDSTLTVANIVAGVEGSQIIAKQLEIRSDLAVTEARLASML